MKKIFKSYAIIWAVLLALYNLTVFLVKPIIPSYAINYDARFWISWGVVIATFVGQLVCAKTAFDVKNNEKLFLNIPLVTQSYTALIAATVVSSTLMLIPNCPAWIAAIICSIVLGLCIIAVAKAKVAADVVGEIDDKIKVQTAFIKMLAVDAEGLIARGKSEAAKTACKKVYEAVRYSDPMSNEGLASVESEITIKFAKFSDAVVAGDEAAVAGLSNDLLILIGERNKKCKFLK